MTKEIIRLWGLVAIFGLFPISANGQADRWGLMKSLQGTYPGWCLDARGIQVSGWTEGCFTASTGQQQQLPMGFNYRANEFLLQQNWLRVERSVDTDATCPTFGFRSDAILPGADYRFTLARGLFSGQLTANDGGPYTYGIDPVQFYAQAYFPSVAEGLDIKLGRIFCQFGVEVIDAPSNALPSHSYTFIYNPFTHTGMVATIQMSPCWSAQLGAVMGPDVFIDPAASPYGMFTVKWAPAGGQSSFLVSGLLGSGRFDEEQQFNNPNIVDIVFTHAFNARCGYTLDALVGYQTDVPDIGTANWFGIVNYVTCTLTECVSSTARLEFFNDEDGNRTGFNTLYTAVSTGLNVRPWRSVILRPELRYDYAANARPFEDKHGLFIAAADVIVRW